MSVRADLWQNNSSKKKRKGLQGGSETWSDVGFGDGGTDKEAELKMFRFSFGVTAIENEYSGGTAQV